MILFTPVFCSSDPCVAAVYRVLLKLIFNTSLDLLFDFTDVNKIIHFLSFFYDSVLNV